MKASKLKMKKIKQKNIKPLNKSGNKLDREDSSSGDHNYQEEKKRKKLFPKHLKETNDLEDNRTSNEEKDEEVDEDIDHNDDHTDEQKSEDSSDDESESEDEESSSEGRKITQPLLMQWAAELSNTKTAVPAFKNLQHALRAAVESIGENKDKESKDSKGPFIVKGPQMFNAVIRVCIRNVPDALYKMCDVKCLSDKPVKTKKWLRIQGNLKTFLRDFVILTASITEEPALEVLLNKGILMMLPFYADLPKLSWSLTKNLITLWSTSHEKVRVMALVGLFRLTRSFNDEKREKLYKLLYTSYANNCRFTSPSTWPVIHFMRSSLAEFYSSDQVIAYKHAFIFIRQLALHLRNAMLVQKKDRMQVVYNWQFVHCLHLWAELLMKSFPSTILNPLIYPLTQICDGIVRLQDSPNFYPLTFHICNILINLSSKTNTFIPVLPYLIEVLACRQLIDKPLKQSKKPFQWECILKVSKSQLTESAFTDGLIDQTLDCAIRYLDTRCNSIAFCELVLPFKIKVKNFMKKCRRADYVRKMNLLLEKIDQNSTFIDNLRKEVSFSITDTKAIKNWEIEVDQKPPPFRKYFEQWKAMKTELKKKETDTQKVPDEFSVSAVRKRQREEMHQEDDDQEIDEEDRPRSKKQKQSGVTDKKPQSKAGKKSRSLKAEDEDEGTLESDVVTEMKLSDYESDGDADTE